MSVADDIMMKPAEVAQMLRRSVESLANDRSRGEGLPFVKVGGSVLYKAADVLTALEDGTSGFTWPRLERALDRFGMPARERSKLLAYLKQEFSGR